MSIIFCIFPLDTFLNIFFPHLYSIDGAARSSPMSPKTLFVPETAQRRAPVWFGFKQIPTQWPSWQRRATNYFTFEYMCQYHGGPSEAGDCSGGWLQSPASQDGDGGKPDSRWGRFLPCCRACIVVVLACKHISDRTNLWYRNVRSLRVRMA